MVEVIPATFHELFMLVINIEYPDALNEVYTYIYLSMYVYSTNINSTCPAPLCNIDFDHFQHVKQYTINSTS